MASSKCYYIYNQKLGIKLTSFEGQALKMCKNELHWGRSKRYVSLKQAENRSLRQA